MKRYYVEIVTFKRLGGTSGLLSLELGFSILALVFVTMIMVDSINLMRAKSSIKEAVKLVAAEIAKLGATSDLTGKALSKETQALALGKKELAVLFPKINFNCNAISEIGCAQLEIDYPSLKQVSVNLSYTVPTYFGLGTTLLATSETLTLESAHLVKELALIGQASFDGEDDE